MTEPLRKPAAFRLDDPRLVMAEPDDALQFETDLANGVPAPIEPLAAAPLATWWTVRWGTLFGSACGALALLGLGWAVARLVGELLTQAPILGAVALGLAVLAGVALLMLTVREAVGLLRLGTADTLRRRAAAVAASDDREQGRALVADLIAFTRRVPRLARARVRLESHLSDIIDGRDLVLLSERELMSPLDAEARRLVLAASKRVSVVTAISPRAAIDMMFVLVNALSLIRKLAVLYGGRPGTLGVLALLRQIVTHLTVTGGMAVTDSVLQQVVGHGIAARLSARLGEGMLNGLLTARLGLLAIDQTRPLPFQALARPSLNELAGSLLRSSDSNASGVEGGGSAPKTR